MSDSTAHVSCPKTDDAFLGGALRVLQPRAGYRAGLDAVLLAASVPDHAQTVLDAGSGVGVAGLAVARRLANARVTMIERDGELAAMAKENIGRNGLEQRVTIEQADILRFAPEGRSTATAAESFDCIIANPPFHVQGRGTEASDATKAGAHAMPDGDLDRWVRFMARMARPGGIGIMIHRADALPDILAAFIGRFGGLIVVPMHPREGEPASRVLIQGTKGSRAPLQLRSGLILHNADHSFRPDVESMLRHGAALNLLKASGKP